MENSREQIRQLSRDGANAANKLKAFRTANANTDQMSNDSTDLVLKSWLTRVSQLKQRFDEHPEQKIPELKFANDQDWLDAAKNNLDTVQDYRRALAKLRDSAAEKFVELIQSTLQKYSQANGGQFPTDLSQLQPYFDNPDNAAILQQYEIVPAFAIPVGVGSSQVITQKSVVDDQYDDTFAIGPNGWGSSSPQSSSVTLLPVINAFLAANNGQQPVSPSQLLPYATTADQQAALQKAILRSGTK